MLLTLTTTAPAATDLGHLLHKHPDRLHERDVGFGTARVFFPEATSARCTAALAVAVDPVGLVRGRAAGRNDGYVTDRPYVAGSLLSVALGRTFSSALAGRAKERAERVAEAMPLVLTLSAVHCPAGDATVRRAFEPLGYDVDCTAHPLDPRFPGWGDTVLTATVRGRATVRDLLRHVYILAPVIDGSKHYYVGLDEVDKLIRHGEGWLGAHPERDWIVRRSLHYRAALAKKALAALVADDADRDELAEEEEGLLETPARLNDQRLAAVLAALRDPAGGIASVGDFGCGEGRLLVELAREPRFTRIVGVDVSTAALDRAEERLQRQHLTTARREAVQLIQGSLVYRDERLQHLDAAVLVEVIEHVDEGRLPALERAVFGHAGPRRVIVTTPNAEYNAVWPSLPADCFRHRDHRFEWSRAQFEAWAERVAAAHRYRVRFQGIGPSEPGLGTPTQMALFDKESGS